MRSQPLPAIAASRPHIALIDISLKNTSGLELIKDLKIQQPAMAVIVVSMHDEMLYAERALRAGARGYVMKRETTGECAHSYPSRARRRRLPER